MRHVTSFGADPIYVCIRLNVNVLDVTLHLIDGFIQTDVYCRPTDSCLYLAPSRAHPKHVFNAIPFEVASRLRRNCSEDFFLNKRLEEYKTTLYIS